MAARVIRLASLSSPKLWRGHLFRLPLYLSSFGQNRIMYEQHPGERMIMSSVPKSKKAMVTVTYICRDGEPITVQGKEGDTLLDIAVNNNLDLEGFGACEGTLACSTCHVILKEEDFKRLPDKPIDEELDMLDLAFGLSETSRLGCQICVTKEFDGLTVQLPQGVNDARNK